MVKTNHIRPTQGHRDAAETVQHVTVVWKMLAGTASIKMLLMEKPEQRTLGTGIKNLLVVNRLPVLSFFGIVSLLT